MRASLRLFGLIAMVAVVGCVEHTPSEALRPNPPAPSYPRIEGRVKSVSSADIREVIRLKQQDMVKEYGRVLPIYTVRVHNKDHIEVQYWGADGVEYWRDARRVKGKWKFDALVLVTFTGTDSTKVVGNNRSNQTMKRTATRFAITFSHDHNTSTSLGARSR